MKNLKTSSSKQSTQIPKPILNKLVWALIVISFLGFLDATFLTAEHYLGMLFSCPIFGGCDKVLTGPYSTVLGVPVALAGAVFYLAVFVLGIAYFDTKQKRLLVFAVCLVPFGFAASLWFLYLQIFAIKALCFYCIISAAISTLLFILGLILRSRLSANEA